MSGVDVSVIVAVYNTMPYLTECLESLVRQSIGLDRLEILAVDDGSTDGSGRELDAFARRYPKTMRVVHQSNSGGPAAPSNRALDMASGRYVFFVGSDDHLGREALDRMVAMADRHGSDIVIGKMVAIGERSVPTAVFRNAAPQIDLVGSGALYALSNTKLFRRALVEEHGLRFAEDLPIGSDLPFTLEAYLRAGVVSVLGDYDCYYAVRRPNDANITFSASPDERVRVAARALDLLEGISERADVRDELLTRLLRVDLLRVFGPGYLRLDGEGRAASIRTVVSFVEERYGGAYEQLEPKLTVAQRLRYRWAFGGDVDALADLIAMDEEGTFPPTVLEGGRAYARYPGFRDGRSGIPDEAFRLLGPVLGRVAGGTRLQAVEWEADPDALALHLRVQVPVVGETESVVARLAPDVMPSSPERKHARILPGNLILPPAPGAFTRTQTDDGAATVLEASIPVERPATGRRPRALEARISVEVGGSAYEIALRGKGVSLPRHRGAGGAAPYHAAVTVSDRGRLLVTVHGSRRPLLARVRSALADRGRSSGPPAG